MKTQAYQPMKLFAFQCGRCSRKLTAQPKLRGSRVKCPGCQTVLVVPGGPRKRQEEEPPEGMSWAPLLWVIAGFLALCLLLLGVFILMLIR